MLKTLIVTFLLFCLPSVAFADSVTPVFEAILKDDTATLEKYLRDGGSVEATANDWTLLKYAVVADKLAAVRILLDHKADPNARDEDGDTPTLSAAGKSSEMFQLLLAHHGDPKIRNKKGQNALMDVCMRLLEPEQQTATLKTIKMLLEGGCEPNVPVPGQVSPLDAAVVCKSPAAVKLLLAAKADVNYTNRDGMTPLIDCTPEDQVEVMKLLLAKGANPKIVDKTGKTALQWAKEYKAKRCIKILTSLH